MDNIKYIDDKLKILVLSLDNVLFNIFKHYKFQKTSKYDIIYDETVYKMKQLIFKKERLIKLNNILNG